MDSPKPLILIGYACGIGAGNTLCEQGPLALKQSPLIKGLNIKWHEMLIPESNQTKLAALNSIVDISKHLAHITYELVKSQQFFVTLGGDHTIAIGSWSGVSSAIAPRSLGLLWIDAHLDSHTPQTTPSGNIHGMPLASLLGKGDVSLAHIMTNSPKIAPENLCIIGVRSYEPEEQHLLEKLNVRIVYMDEIKQKGFKKIFEECIAKITQHSDYFGISLDLDAIDPQEAPGVGTAEANGIAIKELYDSLANVRHNKRLIAAEIAEFNPSLDKGQKTEKIIADILHLFSENTITGRYNEAAI